MNEAIAFDTLRYAKYLAANGFTEQQAETMAEAQVRFLNANLANLATKADIANMATKTDIALVQADIAKVEARLIRWMVGVVLAVAAMQTTLLVGILFCFKQTPRPRSKSPSRSSRPHQMANLVGVGLDRGGGADDIASRASVVVTPGVGWG